MVKGTDSSVLICTILIHGLFCVLHKKKAFCGFCRYGYSRRLLTDKNTDTAFVYSGYSNWKKALRRFEQHATSKAHKEVVLKIEFLDQPSVTIMLRTQHKRDQEILLHSSDHAELQS